MVSFTTLERSRIETVGGYPIRVEEHRRDLSYIVEFYDGRADERAQCITHNPATGELLADTLLPATAGRVDDSTPRLSTTLERSWVGSVNGYPIRVEEHWNNLSYVVEFYDGLAGPDAPCITHCPETGELLTLELLQEEAAALA